MNQRTVLLATDGSDHAGKAEQRLVDRYDPSGCKVILVAVTEVPEMVRHYMGAAGHEAQMLGIQADNISEELSEETRKLAESTTNRLEEKGFLVDVRIPFGNPGEEIGRIAAQEPVDEILVGRRGLGRVGEFLLGSVTQYLVQHATCPVTIVPQKPARGGLS